MKEARPHTSNMNTKMSTTNRGVILASERGARASQCWADSSPGNVGRPGRNAFIEPEDVVIGPNGKVGGGDALNTNDLDGDFDAGPWEDDIEGW